MELKALQDRVDTWITAHGVRYFNELTNMALLTEEVGELARIIARKYGEQSFKENEKSVTVGEEIADIIFVLVCLANQTGVDLEKELEATFKKKSDRDTDRHQSNKKLR